jgi:hypothetical protein
MTSGKPPQFDLCSIDLLTPVTLVGNLQAPFCASRRRVSVFSLLVIGGVLASVCVLGLVAVPGLPRRGYSPMDRWG